MISIAPSLLAADFTRLGQQVADVQSAGAQRLHFDVMDGHFVPNLSMGPMILAALRPLAKVALEVHLMVEEPAKFIEPFVRAGADGLIVHLEVLPDPRPVLQAIRKLGKKACLAVNPETPIDKIAPFLKDIDLALCMTVHPGFGGQRYLPESNGRIRQLRQLIDHQQAVCELEVDGGIDHVTAKSALEAGANVLVAGTSIFRDPRGIAAAVRDFQKIVGAA